LSNEKILAAYNDNMKAVNDNMAQLNKTVPKVTEGMGKVGSGFNDMGDSLKTAANAVKAPAGGNNGGGLLDWLSNLFGGGGNIFGGKMGLSGFANIFQPGSFLTPGSMGGFGSSLRFMAKGDVITGPTMFSTPSGPAIGGESGKEAVMPLKRDSSGALGVTAQLGYGGNVYVNVHSSDGSTAKVKQSQTSNGDTIVDVILQQAKAMIAEDIAKGGTAINTAVEGRYNLKSAAGIK
jgi:phage-related minor tail protein